MPGSTVMFNNVNSFYTPQPFNSIFPSYTVHHTPIRPSSRETDLTNSSGQLSGAPGGGTNSSMRHPSGGSLTGGSVGSHTPPSPEDRTSHYKHGAGSVIMERGVRGSFEQRQCSSVGSDQPTGSPGGGPPYRLQPPSPATQKSPFDMTTMGLSKSVCNYTSTSSLVISPGQFQHEQVVLFSFWFVNFNFFNFQRLVIICTASRHWQLYIAIPCLIQGVKRKEELNFP